MQVVGPVVAAMSAILVAMSSIAQDTESAARALSLEEATEVALRRNPLYRLTQTDVEREIGARKAAEPLLPGNPVVNFEAGPRNLDDGSGTQFSYKAFLEQPVDVAGQRGKRLTAADERIRLAQTRLAAVDAEIRGRARAAYISVLVADRHVTFASERVSQAVRTYAAARLRTAGGASSELEERLAQAELGRARLELMESERDAEQSRLALGALLDLPPEERVEPTSPLGMPPARSEALERLLEIARERNRELEALRQEGRSLDAELAKLRAERIPPVTLLAIIEQDSPNQFWAGPGFRIPTPLFQRNQGPIAETEALKRRSSIALATTESATERDLRTAVRVAQLRRRELVELEANVLVATARSRDLVLEGWRAGKFDLFRLLAVEAEFVAARRAYLQALADVWTAEIEIDRTIGLGGSDARP